MNPQVLLGSRWWQILGVSVCLSLGLAAEPVRYDRPARIYHRESRRGRDFFWELSLWRRDPKTVKAARDRFSLNLEASLAAIPQSARQHLRYLPLYLMDGPNSPQGGRDSGLEYFQGGASQFRPDIDSRWSDCVVVYNIHNYLAQSDLWARKSIQHELAHAYHLRLWSENRPQELLDAYSEASRLRGGAANVAPGSARQALRKAISPVRLADRHNLTPGVKVIACIRVRSEKQALHCRGLVHVIPSKGKLGPPQRIRIYPGGLPRGW